MIYLLSALAVAAVAVDTGPAKQCLADTMQDFTLKTFEGCNLSATLDALELQLDTCQKKLSLCEVSGGGGGGGGNSGVCCEEDHDVAIVNYGDLRFGFATSSEHPKEASFDALHARAIEVFQMDSEHDLHFTYKFGNPEVNMRVNSNIELEEAWTLAKKFDFVLTLHAEKDTHSPTPEPTNAPTPSPTYPPSAWNVHRHVKQVFGNIADGRDSGQPNRRTFKFTKQQPDTLLRLHYEDNLRVYQNGAVCYWEFYIDGARIKNDKWVRGGMHGQNQANNNNDHQTSSIVGLAAGYGAGEHTFSIHLSGNNRDCYTGWDPDSKGVFMMEVREVKIGEHGYYAMTSRLANGDDNKKELPDRKLAFKKASDSSRLRLLYTDNFRAYNGASCRWTIYVDGKECTQPGAASGSIAQSAHSHGGENDHVPNGFMGYCEGIAAGDHVMTIGVDGSGDCYTGWESSHHLEAEEIPDKQFAYIQGMGNVNQDTNGGFINTRLLQFTKKTQDSTMRFLYSDNLRIHGHGVYCKWELRVDDQACPKVNLSGNRHCNGNDNNHFPGMIMGYCEGIAAGAHTLRVHVKGNGDCHTGWDRQSRSNWVLEAQEIDSNLISGEMLTV